MKIRDSVARRRDAMAENQMRATNASVAAFISAVADEKKRADARALVKLMGDASGEKPKMWGPSIIGFGTCHYVYESGREGDMPLVGFSPRKAAIVLYICKGFPGSEALYARLGKHTTSVSCLYVKRLADLDQKVLEKLVVKSLAATRKKYGLASQPRAARK